LRLAGIILKKVLAKNAESAKNVKNAGNRVPADGCISSFLCALCEKLLKKVLAKNAESAKNVKNAGNRVPADGCISSFLCALCALCEKLFC